MEPIGVDDVAALMDVRPETVRQTLWRARQARKSGGSHWFPEPTLTLGGHPVWDLTAFQDALAARRRKKAA